MKLLLVLFSLVAVVAAYGYSNTFSYVRPWLGHNRVFDDFDVPRHRRNRHHRRHRDSSDSDSRGSYEDDYFFWPQPHGYQRPSYGGNANNYGSPSNDAPAPSQYGSAVQYPPVQHNPPAQYNPPQTGYGNANTFGGDWQ